MIRIVCFYFDTKIEQINNEMKWILWKQIELNL